MPGPSDLVPGADWLLAFVLAATFVIAAMKKVADPVSTGLWLSSIGIQHGTALVRWGIAYEFAVVAAIVAWPRVGALMAAVFLLIGVLLLARSSREGVPGCACFGSPVSEAGVAGGVVRNLLLLACAVLLLALPSGGPAGAALALSVAAVAAACCVWVYVRRFGVVLLGGTDEPYA